MLIHLFGIENNVNLNCYGKSCLISLWLSFTRLLISQKLLSYFRAPRCKSYHHTKREHNVWKFLETARLVRYHFFGHSVRIQESLASLE